MSGYGAGGWAGGGDSSAANLTIVNRNIVAVSLNGNSAGIGACLGNASLSDILIFDGNITAISSLCCDGYGAGIGLGGGANWLLTVKNLAIDSGNINAGSTFGSGVGSGCGGN
jgi:hypothetical protein